MHEIHVEVTQADIDKARAAMAHGAAEEICPLAQALTRQTGTRAKAFYLRCYVGNRRFATDTAARAMIYAFDNGDIIKPTTVCLIED